MAKNDRYSRLNPVYLSRRHAGTVMLFLALGLLAGVVWQALIRPVRYRSAVEAAVSVTPAELAHTFDWQAKQREWNALLRNRQEWGLLGSNLRHAVKLAATQDMVLAPQRLSEMLTGFADGEEFSASLFLNPHAARLGTSIRIERADIAANMDFQSLAVVAADLDPVPGVEGWDFSFFTDFLPRTPQDAAIVGTDRDDPYFRVFYTLHAVVRDREAPTASDAWKATIEEVTERLERESSFAGGGGFGPHARRELAREIAAIPVLAANSLYHATSWYRGESENFAPESGWAMRWAYDTQVDLERHAQGAGLAKVASGLDLYPLAFPRDTVFTRIPPLVATTVLATLAAREDRLNADNQPTALPEHQVIPPPAIAAPASDAVEPEIMSAPAPVVTYREELDDIADKQRLSHIAMLEEAVRMTERDSEACVRRLQSAREDENRLSFEAMNARNRADRLRERYDEACILAEPDYEPKVSDETQRLLSERDRVARKLNDLLAYCTVEHPFVKTAFRELEALEKTLDEHKPDAAANKAAEQRATRIATIYLEWETASAAADSLEERRRRQAEAVSCLLDETTTLECTLSERQMELAEARRLPVPIRRVAVVTELPSQPSPPPPPEPEPEPAAVAEQPAPPLPAQTAKLAFASPPIAVPVRKSAPGHLGLWWGLAGGLAAGLFVSLVRELLAQRFSGPGEARRLVKLPVLATLPAYDPASLRRAAATVKGDLTGKRAGSMRFTPAPVETFEPLAEARRGKLVPAKRRSRIGVWVATLALILCAALLYYRSFTGFAQPYAAFRGDMPQPGATIPSWTEEREAETSWGDLP